MTVVTTVNVKQAPGHLAKCLHADPSDISVVRAHPGKITAVEKSTGRRYWICEYDGQVVPMDMSVLNNRR